MFHQVAGAIYWARQLLHRIEEPMKIFRDTKAVSNLRDFSRICKVSYHTSDVNKKKLHSEYVQQIFVWVPVIIYPYRHHDLTN